MKFANIFRKRRSNSQKSNGQNEKVYPELPSIIEDDKAKEIRDMESNDFERIPYPKRVFFIIGNEFCERFNFYGMKTILVVYLKDKLGYTENSATVVNHVFTMAVYFMCIFGGIISDIWLGKYRMILYLSILYSIGSTIVTLSSIPNFQSSADAILMVGLTLIAIGSGGIKPCVSAFGGDQFKLPQQAAQLATFFSLFYFSINLGSLFSTFFSPMMKKNVYCFGNKDCYPLAFGTPAILMMVSIVLFMLGKPSYTIVKKSSENMVVQVSKCVTNAISTKIREHKINPRENLLDYSNDKYGERLVGDTRALLQILLLYTPLPIFWALFDQQGSRWIFQAQKMNCDIGFYTILPEQMQVINPLLVLIFIPAFDAAIYPLLRKIGIRQSLQKMVIGGMLAAIAFLISGIVQFRIEWSPEKSVSVLWQIPQYVVISMAEVMFSVTGLDFSYEQAPAGMKSVVQAFWLLTVAVGNVLLVLIVKLEIFTSRAHEFLLFSALMVVDMLIFIYLAYRYTKNKLESKQSNDIALEKVKSNEK